MYSSMHALGQEGADQPIDIRTGRPALLVVSLFSPCGEGVVDEAYPLAGWWGWGELVRHEA